MPTPEIGPTAIHLQLTRLEELALLDRLLYDDASAWPTFVRSYGRLIGASITKVVARFRRHGCSEDVREIEAAFHLELLSNDKAKLRAFAPERNVRLSSWLSLLASRAAYDFLRRRRREPFSEAEFDPEAFVSADVDAFTLCDFRERVRLVSELVTEFTAKDRLFLDLYCREELDAEQIAEKMGISLKTVYSKKNKIQGRLQELVKRRVAA